MSIISNLKNKLYKKKEELYFVVDRECDVFSYQKLENHIKDLRDGKIKEFGLSIVNPDFLESKEEELSLSRSLLSYQKGKTPFYLRVSMYQIVEPKNFRLTLTFVLNQKLKRFTRVEAKIDDIISIWNHLISGRDLSEYHFANWFDKSEWYENYLKIRERQEKIELEHPPLLNDLYWDFTGGRYQNKETFIKAVDTYQRELKKKWDPEEKLNAPLELIVFYSYLKDGREKTGKMTLKNPKAWTSSDLLMAIHNKCANKIQIQDNHFMEGLSYHNHNKEGIPSYFLHLGS